MTDQTLKTLGIEDLNPGGFDGEWVGSGEILDIYSPIDGKKLGSVQQVTGEEYDRIVDRAHAAWLDFRKMPPPRRGEMVRQLGERLREKKDALGALVTMEMGKILPEGKGEVQEMIDICDFAVGLSRQLYGLTMASERQDHHMREQWHPLGVVGIISAFNFPVAVWAWNAALAAVCGDATVWKPSERTPLTAVAVTKIAASVCKDFGVDPAIFSLAVGDGPGIGEKMINDSRIALVSATGSTRMGKRVAEVVGGRLGRTILELGGNNAIIVTPNANLALALPGILFGSVGTAGQRCTSTRRILVHASVKDELVSRLVRAYKDVPIGNPLAEGTLMGPLLNDDSVTALMAAKEKVVAAGGEILYGGEKLEGDDYPGGRYVIPCLALARNEFEIVQHETFAPILYIIEYGSKGATGEAAITEMEEAMKIHNDVPQGLSSSIFTDHVREAEYFLSHRGSDCGIANVNIGTSGAEIGGAFGGEKETGGGRESGSDAWKAYMRRQTNTVNWSTELPLAQGIKFG